MNSNVGLVSLKELRRKREESEKPVEEALTDEVPQNKKIKKKPVSRKPKLSFEDDGEEEIIIRKPKRDNTIDTSSLKTKKQLHKEQEESKKEKELENAKHEKIKQEVIEFPFVYYDGAETPGSVQIKKGDVVWMVLEKTRKNYKPFHRGTVDDILLVKHNIIIPHVSLFYTGALIDLTSLAFGFVPIPC